MTRTSSRPPRRPRRRSVAPPPPPSPTRWERLVATVRRNPLKALTVVLGALAAVPGGYAGAAFVDTILEPWWVAQHYWVRDQLSPITKVQEHQAVGLDQFLLFQQQQALSDTRNDPGYSTSPIVKERAQLLEQQIKSTKTRLCKATGKESDCADH